MNTDEHDDVKSPKFKVGWGVKKDKGSARYVGIIKATYVTENNERRYIVEIFGYRMQYIASWKELTVISRDHDVAVVASVVYGEAIKLLSIAYNHYLKL